MFFGDNKDLENLIRTKTWGKGFELVNDKIKLLIPTTRPSESKILITMIRGQGLIFFLGQLA